MKHRMKPTTIRGAIALLLLATFGSGCNDPVALNTIGGTLIGGGAGAGAGALIAPKGHKGEGAAIGGGIGALAGALIGHGIGESVAREKAQYANDEAFLRKQVNQAGLELRQTQQRNEALRQEIGGLRQQYDGTRTELSRAQLKSKINDRVEPENLSLFSQALNERHRLGGSRL